MKFLFPVLGAVLLFPVSVCADVRLPRLFTDNMVLQQETHNAIWGWATPQEPVTVSASWGASASSITDANGVWKVFLETPSYGVGHVITVRGGDKATEVIHIHNVAVGEVWLCAGQSNMGWSVGNSFESEKEATVDLPHFRIFKSIGRAHV